MDGSRRPLTVKRLAGAIGAEIGGITLSPDLPEAVIAQLRSLWLEHGVVFFRDQQHLDAPALAAFARRFGEVVEYPFVKGLPEAPEVIPIVKLENEATNFGGLWHTDTAYLERPPMATMLIAREVPPYGGDTLFASGYAAYETLSPGLKRLLDPLRAVNSSAKADVTKTREDRLKDSARDGAKTVYESEHPVVRTHPETGRKALYLGRRANARIEGVPPQESEALLDALWSHAVDEAVTWHHRWQPGDLLVWDNRCTLHRATPFESTTHVRDMRRSTVIDTRYAEAMAS
jgi:taurine dioxygenase